MRYIYDHWGMTNTLGPGRVSILQWSILTLSQLWQKTISIFLSLFPLTVFLSLAQTVETWLIISHIFSSLKSAAFGRFYPFLRLPKVAFKRKFNIFIGTQDSVTTQKTAFTFTRLLQPKQRRILTVLVDLPAEELLVCGVRGAGLQEVVSWLGGAWVDAVALVVEWVGTQCILIAVALVAV